MTTSELIKHLKSIDPSGNLPVVRFVNGSQSITLTEDDALIHWMYEDDSSIPSIYYSDPDAGEDSVQVVCII